MAEPLSYAQSLRVIGQDLDKFQLKSFSLEKRGDEYVVQIEGESHRKSSLQDISKLIIQKTLGSHDPLEEIPKLLRFTTTEILCSDIQRQMKRCEPGGLPVHNLSVVLRALGAYLDRKRAGEFAIGWSRYSVKVTYDQKEEYFTTNNLHDLAVGMYLKRVNRP
jgi:hypothetical protein